MYQKVKIYTEDKGNVENLTAKYFPGFTLIHCSRYYRSVKKHSVIIEIVENFKDNATLIRTLNQLLENILFINSQEYILIDVNGIHHQFYTNIDLPNVGEYLR